MSNILNFETHNGQQKGILTIYLLCSLKKKPKSGYELISEIKEKTEALTQAFQKASTAIYQQAAKQYQQQPGQQGAGQEDAWKGHPSDDDSTINADYKVKGEKKKKKDDDTE